MKQMKFDDLPTTKGICTTVRLYDPKWMVMEPGNKVSMLSTKAPYALDAQVVYLHVSSIDDLPADVFKTEHDPECRGKTGLTNLLARHYAGTPINGKTAVVAIGLWVY